MARPAAMILPEQSSQVRVLPLLLVRRGARQDGAPYITDCFGSTNCTYYKPIVRQIQAGNVSGRHIWPY